MAPTAPADRNGFQIAIICALDIEADAVHDVLDKFWEDEGIEYDQAYGDNNSYTTGVIGEHNVVLAYMPGVGTVDASAVAANLQVSFRGIKLTLLVGICGGVPNYGQSSQIFLGDLVISTSVIQYDFGKQHPAMFERMDTLEGTRSRPSQRIRGILTKLKTRRYYQKMQSEIQEHIREAQVRHPGLVVPGRDTDHLFETSHLHKHHTEHVGTTQICQTCDKGDAWTCSAARRICCDDLGCDMSKSVLRLKSHETFDDFGIYLPDIHFGKIGSGNAVIRSGEHRDNLAKSDGIIAFEMESAGIWDQFPNGFLMIKGVCDYADSHKNDIWQPYAATVAAAGMKALLKKWSSADEMLIQDSSSIYSMASGAVGARYDSVNTVYNNVRTTQSTALKRIDSQRSVVNIHTPQPKLAHVEDQGLRQLQYEIKNIAAAMDKMQSDMEIMLAILRPTEPPKPEPPVRFLDAIGRNYNFPWERCKRWKDMESLITQSFQHIEQLDEQVANRRYDLMGPDKEIILPEYWELVVKPDMRITMFMWPLPEPRNEDAFPAVNVKDDTIPNNLVLNGNSLSDELVPEPVDLDELSGTNTSQARSHRLTRWVSRLRSNN